MYPILFSYILPCWFNSAWGFHLDLLFSLSQSVRQGYKVKIDDLFQDTILPNCLTLTIPFILRNSEKTKRWESEKSNGFALSPHMISSMPQGRRLDSQGRRGLWLLSDSRACDWAARNSDSGVEAPPWDPKNCRCVSGFWHSSLWPTQTRSTSFTFHGRSRLRERITFIVE